MRALYFYIVFIFLSNGFSAAQTPPFEKIDSVLKRLYSDGVFSGSVLIGEKERNPVVTLL